MITPPVRCLAARGSEAEVGCQLRVSDRLATAGTSCGEGAVLVNDAVHGGGSVRSRAELTQALRGGGEGEKAVMDNFWP